MTAPTLAGFKVSLNPKTITDARRDYNWQKDAELMAFSGNQPLRESFLEYLISSASAYSTNNETEVFAIRTLQENRHIGNCAIYQIDYTVGEAQLGIAIGERNYWGKGYGCDAVKVACTYAFDQLKLAKLRLKTLENNTRARLCFEKCGFAPCGTLYYEGRHYILMEMSANPIAK